MKKLLLLIFVLTLCLSTMIACGGKVSSSKSTTYSSQESTTSSSESSQEQASSSLQSGPISSSNAASSNVSSTPTLSSDTSLTITSIFGFTVESSKILLTSSEYARVLENKADLLNNTTYTLADKASVIVSLNEDTKVIKYTVIAEDGTTKDYIIDYVVKSNLAEITINEFFGVKVIGGIVDLPEKVYEGIGSVNLLEKTNYTSSLNSSVTASLATNKRSITYTCVSEDGSTTNLAIISLLVANNYGATSTGWGSKDNIAYNYEKGLFVLNGTSSLYNDSVIVKEYWAIETRVSFESITENCELVFLSYDEDDLQMRYVLRATSTNTLLLFTDYKDNSGFLNYLELKTDIAFSQGEFLKVELVNYKNNFIIKLNGETVYRRELANIVKAEMVISSVNCTAYINDLTLTQGESQVKSLMDSALSGYTEKNYGVSILGSLTNSEQIIVNSNGDLYIGGKDSNSRVLAQFYHKGIPVGGYEYAISGTLLMENTKTSGSAASKVELQIFKDFSNYKKMQFYRFDSGTTQNNSYYDITRLNGGSETNTRDQNNTFASGSPYSLDYIIIYNHGQLQLFVKDLGTTYADYTKLEDETHLDWGYTGAAFAMNQYTDLTLKNTKVYYGEEFDKLYKELNSLATYTMSSSYSEKVDSDVISKGEGNVYYATYRDKPSNTYVFKDGAVIGGLSYVLSGTMFMSNYTDWSQAEVGIYLDETHGVRFVLEQATSGNYQVFTEYKNGQTNWQGWKVLLSPSASVPAPLNFSIIAHNGRFYFAINGVSYQVYENLFSGTTYVYFNGKNNVTKITNLATITNSADVQIFIENLSDYVYVSKYESTMQKIYEANVNAAKGGILFAGSSSIDFWDSSDGDGKGDFVNDMAGYNAYNVGIGGTNSKDWTYAAYDRLIKHFEPSKFILFLGGNDISGGGTVEEASTRLGTLLTKVHTDFPSCEIYYILITPSPLSYNWETKTYKGNYGALNNAMKNLAAQNTWINIIDMEPAFTSLSTEVYGGVGTGIWADNQHLNAEGYRIWATIIKSTIFSNDSYTQVLANSWTVTKNTDGSSIFTSTVNKAWLNFNNILLHSKAVVEFDFKVTVAPTDYIQGVLFGMTSKTDNTGYCVGRAGNTKRIGGSVMGNGGFGAWGSTATTQNWTLDSTGENATIYHYTLEFDLTATQAVVIVTVSDGTSSYARTFTFASQGTYDFRTGRYLGLYGGSAGGRVEISNVSVYGFKL